MRPFFWPTVALLAVNIVLTITDEFGMWDLATLVANLATLVLLVRARRQAVAALKPVGRQQ